MRAGTRRRRGDLVLGLWACVLGCGGQSGGGGGDFGAEYASYAQIREFAGRDVVVSYDIGTPEHSAARDLERSGLVVSTGRGAGNSGDKWGRGAYGS